MKQYGYRFYTVDDNGDFYSPYMDSKADEHYDKESKEPRPEDVTVVEPNGNRHVNRRNTIRVGGSLIGQPAAKYSLFNPDELDELDLPDEICDLYSHDSNNVVRLPESIKLPLDWKRETMSNALLDTKEGIDINNPGAKLYKVDVDSLIKAQDIISKNLSGQRDFSPELVAKYIKPVKDLDIDGFAKAVAALKNKIPWEDRMTAKGNSDYDKYLSDLLNKYLDYDENDIVSDRALKNITADLSKDCYISSSIIDAVNRRF